MIDKIYTGLLARINEELPHKVELKQGRHNSKVLYIDNKNSYAGFKVNKQTGFSVKQHVEDIYPTFKKLVLETIDKLFNRVK